MAPIQIAERFRPFSHTPGTFALIPFSTYAIEVFPALFRLYDWSQEKPALLQVFEWNLEGPLEDFTIESNLENGSIKVWLTGPFGYLRYEIRALRGEVYFFLEKPTQTLHLNQSVVPYRQWMNLLTWTTQNIAFEKPTIEKLSLGNNKAQDIDLIKRRKDLKEIVPLFYSLAQMIPFEKVEGELDHLLYRSMDSFHGWWVDFFSAAFKGIFTPVGIDEYYQGLIRSPTVLPIALIKKGWTALRQLLVHENGSSIFLLPKLPKEFHSGRLLKAVLHHGTLDVEWTKKTIRRMAFQSASDQEVAFHFRNIRTFRLNKNQRYSSGEMISLKKNCHYFFDNFL